MRAKEIFVLSREEAMRFNPANDSGTYVVRVFDRNNAYFSLNCSMNRIVWVDEFFVDHFDITGGNKKKDIVVAMADGTRIFNRRNANELIDNFVKNFREGMDLMVHCRYGKNRSAGIAFGLNDLFDLGHNYLGCKHSEFDQHIYFKILRAGLFNSHISDEKKEQIRKYIS